MSAVQLGLDHPALAHRTGRGVRVAVVDSGIVAGHPHVGPVEAGIHLSASGDDEDFRDRIGHGTAVAAAIREKAPGADLVAVRVFERDLSCDAGTLARAIVWASDHGARLINLSLGTDNALHEAALADAVRHAVSREAVVVAAGEADGRRWLPGGLPGVVAVRLDWDCPRQEVRITTGDQVFWVASGYPRPIPGIPPERNLKGLSFAVANVTGVLARLLEA